MKSHSCLVAAAITLLAVQSQSHAQQSPYDSYGGYGNPVAYSQPVPFPPQTGYLPAQAMVQPAAYGYSMQEAVSQGGGAAACPDCGTAGGCSCGGGSGCACDPSCCDPCCYGPKWFAFGDYLYMRPRDAEVAYAVPIDGPVDEPDDPKFQIGPTAVADFDYESAFRVGFGVGVGEMMSIGSTYTYFDTDTTSSTSILPGDLIHSLVSHRQTDTASQQFLSATADYSMDFDLVDVDFRRVVSCGSGHQVTCLLGARYAGLQQDFVAEFTAPNNEETVTTDVHFDGGGIRVGLDAEWYGANRRCFVYGRSAASFVAGEFKASYRQNDLFGREVIYTDWRGGRIVSMLDLEVGIGFTNRNGWARASVGYMVSGWFNTVNTDEFIKAVAVTSDFTGLNNSMTFDGAVARAEIRF